MFSTLSFGLCDDSSLRITTSQAFNTAKASTFKLNAYKKYFLFVSEDGKSIAQFVFRMS
jgi:hypothetical protein